MYAILDIETTGGAFNEEGITEIAIYRYDGHEVVDQFISLVNPEREIQPFVVNLTGINNKMLRNAPKFYEVAKRIVEITNDCILVAHNANFDYRILRTEFKRLGFDFERKTLCTVELSKELIPGLESYKLGKLVRTLGIPMSDRHRATGDALATVQLFKLLLAKDSQKKIISSHIKLEVEKKLAPKLLDILDDLPSVTGVYYIHGKKGEIIYIGKSKNIKRRVNQHFTGSARKSKKIQLEVVKVTYEETGSELIALLKETEEIKVNRPKYNRSKKGSVYSYGLRHIENGSSYHHLKIEKVKQDQKYLVTYKNHQEARSALYKITEEYELCQKLTGLDKVDSACFMYTVKKCHGACIDEENANQYNERVQSLIDKHTFKHQNLLIVDKGRTIDERSAILIESGEYKGFGFYNLNYQVNNIEVLKAIITPMQNNSDVQHIIQSFLRRKKVMNIIDLDEN